MSIAKRISKAARDRRSAWFRAAFAIGPNTRILDLGSEDGSNIRSVLEGTDFDPANVFIADIDDSAILKGEREFGFTPVLLDELGPIPFGNGFFDIVYCSSVIEHVTVPKSDVWSVCDRREFRRRAIDAQVNFASEIRRLGIGYWVQTPAKWFPIESHTWLPFLSYLTRSMQVRVIKIANQVWVKATIPDFELLDGEEMARLFPDARIVRERVFGLTKSFSAVRN